MGELLRQLPRGRGGVDRQDPSEDPQCTVVVGKRATISPAGLRQGTLGTKVISIANANRPEVAVILNASRSQVYGR